MTVRAKMRVTSVTTMGDAKKPSVQVELGAVYSSDPQSENKSFANATPTGSVRLNIDAGRPAAKAFRLGEECYVDITPLGIPERTYIGDYGFVPGPVLVEARDGSKQRRLTVTTQHQLQEADGTMTSVEKLKAEGIEFWRHVPDEA